MHLKAIDLFYLLGSSQLNLLNTKVHLELIPLVWSISSKSHGMSSANQAINYFLVAKQAITRLFDLLHILRTKTNSVTTSWQLYFGISTNLFYLFGYLSRVSSLSGDVPQTKRQLFCSIVSFQPIIHFSPPYL